MVFLFAPDYKIKATGFGPCDRELVIDWPGDMGFAAYGPEEFTLVAFVGPVIYGIR